LDKLPNKKNIIKLNLLVSDKNGTSNIYYITDDKIKQFNLPNWIRGCNSIDKRHVSVDKYCDNNNINKDSLFTCLTVEKKTLYDVLQNYNIAKIKYLKIDTEGHDCYIINKFIDDIQINGCYHLLPLKIRFEANILSPTELIESTYNRLILIGYNLISRGEDIVMCL
jgi:FkbM family methyltransferase